VAYAALPIVILLGLLSFLRLVDISVEDVGALRAINRIRAYYGGLVPDGLQYFPTPGKAINELVDARYAALGIAATVGVMDALVVGASLALAHAGLATPLAVVIGLALALVMTCALFAHQTHRFHAALRAGETAAP
jgi:hypothetical protein